MDIIIAAAISAVGYITVALINRRGVKSIKSDLKTSNGDTIGQITEQVKGRLIKATTKPEERTKAEQEYVELSDEGIGHQ